MANIDRREFLKLVERGGVFIGITALTVPIVAYFYPPSLEEVPSEPVLVCAENELAVNESRTVRFGRYPALVLNSAAGLRAYSGVCTHFGCIVKWDAALSQIVCPCHDGFFDPLDGSVISGPPPEALTPLPVRLVEGQIYVGGEA